MGLLHRPRRWSRLRAVVEYDFFPVLGERVRQAVYTPLAVLMAAAVAALLCGFTLHAQGFVLCGCLLAVIGIGIIWPWLTLPAQSGAIAFDRDRCSEGDDFEVRLTLHNRLPWRVRGLTIRIGFGDEPTAVAIAAVPARRTVVCRWRVVASRRGVFPSAGPRLATGFPFGLWEPSRPLEVEGNLIVWPKTYPVGPVPPVRGDRHVEGNVSRNRAGSSGDVLGVRPYRRGDSPRRIHWGQTAKHDRLIVCELQANARPMIQIVLDEDPAVHSGRGPDGSREWAVRVAASLARGWLELGAQVGLAWAGFDLPPASGDRQTRQALDALAALPELGGRPLAELLACPQCQGHRDGLQVIVTTDRAEGSGGCETCAADDQRWVVLLAGAFADDPASVPPGGPGPGPAAWLCLDSRVEVPARLRDGWREARHGS